MHEDEITGTPRKHKYHTHTTLSLWILSSYFCFPCVFYHLPPLASLPFLQCCWLEFKVQKQLVLLFRFTNLRCWYEPQKSTALRHDYEKTMGWQWELWGNSVPWQNYVQTPLCCDNPSLAPQSSTALASYSACRRLETTKWDTTSEPTHQAWFDSTCTSQYDKNRVSQKKTKTSEGKAWQESRIRFSHQNIQNWPK